MKSQCDKHGCKELLCGCSTFELETKNDISEIIKAKDKWIAELLDDNERMKNKIAEFIDGEDQGGY